jgi:hypothetical protein
VHGELAQLIALAAHGSVWLAGITPGPAPRLDAGNSMFRFVRRVRFELNESSRRGSTTASDVASWLQGAQDRGVERFWLCLPEPGAVSFGDDAVPERELVAFASAGRWFLLGSSPGRSEVWHALWEIGDRDGSDRGIWEVEYRGESVDERVVPPRPDISASAQRLVAALQKVEAFARTKELTRWADWFAKARRAGAGDLELPPSDILPARGFSDVATRVLDMAMYAWVFGGMGSWNDLAFRSREQEDEYERVSAELYSAVLEALVAGVNSELEH